MLKVSKLRFIMRSAAATLVVALAAVGSVGATTTIGTNISTDGTLTVASTSTLQAAASITSTTNPQLTVKYDTTNYMTQGVSATGVVTFTRYGSALQKGFTLADTVAIASSTLQTLLTVESSSSSNASTTLAVYQFGTGDIFRLYDSGTQVFTVKDGGTVGVGSSTPWGLLSVAESTETYSFIVSHTGSTTPAFVITGIGGAGGGGRTGIGTSTPSALFSIGKTPTGIATGTMFALGFNDSTYVGTTTVDLGKVCFKSLTEVNTVVYWWWSVNNTGFTISSSTTSCF